MGPGLTAKAISAGGGHTCAILNDGDVKCWGSGFDGQLGSGNGNRGDLGDAPTDTPDTVAPIDLGAGRTAVAISAGEIDTCAILDNGSLLCWGYAFDGRLGYGSTPFNIGVGQTPGQQGPIDLGPGRTAVAVSAGDSHTCAILDDGSVRCWGVGFSGQLGYGNQNNAGNTPSSVPGLLGPVDLGPGRTANGYQWERCNSAGANCGAIANTDAASYTLAAIDVGSTIRVIESASEGGGAGVSAASAQTAVVTAAAVVSVSDSVRQRGFRTCLATVAAHEKHARALTHRGSKRRRAQARRRLAHQLASGRSRCVKLWGRTPGPVTGLQAIVRGTTKVELDFNVAGTNADSPPAATSYLVKQSLSPITTRHDFNTAAALCHGACHFTITQIGTKIALVITGLHPHTTYYYAIAALDNVTGRPGPRTDAVQVKTA